MSEPSDTGYQGPVADSGAIGDMGLSDEALRLDGNAAAGVLAEIFAIEMTSARSTCGHCGQTTPVGGLLLYGGQIGTVLRCPTCHGVQLRLVRVPEQGGTYYLDLRGVALLRIPAIPS